MGISAQRQTFLRQTVAEGVRLLDAKEPHWYTRINLGTLDMAECDRCILGQVYGNYTEGVEKVFLVRVSPQGPVPDRVYDYGFNAPLVQRTYKEEIVFLAECWKAVIEKRNA
jgi:hypothetical protein